MAGLWATRVYIAAGLVEGGAVALSPGQAHHLRTVLRLAKGAGVAAFNADDGEWLCRIGELGRKGGELLAERRLREPAPEADLWLLFAPVKRMRLDWLVEKASELGTARFIPVATARGEIPRLNLDRLRAHAIAAAEQSERLSLPEIRPLQPLDEALAGWPHQRTLFVGDESGGGEPIAAAAARLFRGQPVALLIGPEGGFAQSELDALGKLPFVSRVGLGPRVLRAETAALAGLAIVQAIAGDWRSPRSR